MNRAERSRAPHFDTTHEVINTALQPSARHHGVELVRIRLTVKIARTLRAHDGAPVGTSIPRVRLPTKWQCCGAEFRP